MADTGGEGRLRDSEHASSASQSQLRAVFAGARRSHSGVGPAELERALPGARPHFKLRWASFGDENPRKN